MSIIFIKEIKMSCTALELLKKINSKKSDKLFIELYGKENLVKQKKRYSKLLKKADKNLETKIFSSPGRTELGGNHTDHNNGKVIAASIHLDSIACVQKNETHPGEAKKYCEMYKEMLGNFKMIQ